MLRSYTCSGRLRGIGHRSAYLINQIFAQVAEHEIVSIKVTFLFPVHSRFRVGGRLLLLLSTSYTKYKISINTKKQKEKQKNIEKQKKT